MNCEIMTQLYLMCPDPVKKEADIILVNKDNVVMCLDLWKKSSIFDYGHVLRVMINDGIKATPRASSEVYIDVNLPFMYKLIILFIRCRCDIITISGRAGCCGRLVSSWYIPWCP